MTAQLTFMGGQLLVPAQTPYDRQQLVEHVQRCTRTYGQVRVRVDEVTWWLEPLDGRQELLCRGCARAIDHVVCRRSRTSAATFCVTCAMAQHHLTVGLLAALPARAILRDVQAHSAHGAESIAWMRWPQASPAEIIEDIYLQRRFAPVLTWRCAEIRLPPRRAGSAPGQIRGKGVRLRG